MNRPLLLIASLLTIPLVARADTENHGDVPPNWLAGVIATDRTLTAESPGPNYFVYGDVTVPTGVTLTIEPGVRLTFADRSDFLASGQYPDRSELIIQGTLVAQGNASRIYFDTVSGGSPYGAWGGIFVSGSASLAHVDVQHAMSGLNGPGTVSIDDGLIGYHLNSGINVTGGLSMTNTEVFLAGFGVWTSHGAPVTISNSVVHDCAIGVNTDHTQLTIGSSTFRSMSNWAVIGDESPSVLITNSNIAVAQGAVSAKASNVELFRVTAVSVRDGFDLDAGAGHVAECSLNGLDNSAGTGLVLTGSITTTPVDSFNVTPIKIYGFNIGVRLDGTPRARNIVAWHCGYGFYTASGLPTIDYCTAEDCQLGGIWAADFNRLEVRNSLVTHSAIGIRGSNYNQPSYVTYSDLWANGEFTSGFVTVGSNCAAFDPSYTGNGTDPYVLAPKSLFTDFSGCGGGIGAYGPGLGPGSPTSGVGGNARAANLLVSPNPVRGSPWKVTFSLANPTQARLEAFDLSGRRVWEGTNASFAQGWHNVSVSKKLPHGVYLLRLKFDGQQLVKKFAVSD